MKIFIEKACGPPFDLKLPNFYPDCVWKNRTQTQTQRCVWCKRKRTPDSGIFIHFQEKFLENLISENNFEQSNRSE